MSRFPFTVAYRYFRTKRKRNFINIISNLSMIGVAVGTMALVVVLSVFNGLEGFIKSLYNTFDPDIQVVSTKGKSFEMTDSLKTIIDDIPGLAQSIEVIEDNAYVKYRDAEMIVTIKGVTPNFIQQKRMDQAIVQGDMMIQDGNVNYAIVGRGVQYSLSISVKNDFHALQFYYPNRDATTTALNPLSLVKQKSILPAGVFAIEKRYDMNYVFVPLRFAEELFQYKNRRTGLEIELKPGASNHAAQEYLQAHLGGRFDVLDSDQQHAGLLKVLKIEKLFVILTFTFILAVASFNIFFSLSMLAIEKRRDISVLFSMGATERHIRRIFIYEGALIALTGAGIGLSLGFLICWLQQTFGLVSMGMASSIIDAYPVKMEGEDFLLTAIIISAITLLAAFRPAILAARVKFRDYLQ